MMNSSTSVIFKSYFRNFTVLLSSGVLKTYYFYVYMFVICDVLGYPFLSVITEPIVDTSIIAARYSFWLLFRSFSITLNLFVQFIANVYFYYHQLGHALPDLPRFQYHLEKRYPSGRVVGLVVSFMSVAQRRSRPRRSTDQRWYCTSIRKRSRPSAAPETSSYGGIWY